MFTTFLALFAVSLFDGVLHICDSVVDRDYVSQLEEGRLQHGVGSSWRLSRSSWLYATASQV